MNLDDRLRSIFTDVYIERPEVVEAAIKAIKQAFADEGYVGPLEFLKLSRQQAKGRMTGKEWQEQALKEGWRKLDADSVAHFDYEGKRMSGKEWYSAYKKQLHGIQIMSNTQAQVDSINNTLEICDTAAKRASGLSDD